MAEEEDITRWPEDDDPESLMGNWDDLDLAWFIDPEVES